MASQEIYIDPAINANSGDGSIGNPYGDLQHAFNSVTHSTSGSHETRFNVKSGTAEVFSADASWSFSTANSRPIVVEGYDSTAGDGGRAEITCTGGGFLDEQGADYIRLVNLDITGDHSDYLVHLDQGCSLHGVKITQNGNGGCLFLDQASTISECHFIDNRVGGSRVTVGATSTNPCKMINTIIEYSGNSHASEYFDYINNLIIVKSASGYGLKLTFRGHAQGNIIVNTNSGTNFRYGIDIGYANGQQVITGNYIEGFNGTNASAIKIAGPFPDNVVSLNNYYFNCTRGLSDGSNPWPYDLTTTMQDAILLGSSAVDVSGGDYSIGNDTMRDLEVGTAGNGFMHWFPFRNKVDEGFSPSGGGGTDASARFVRLK